MGLSYRYGRRCGVLYAVTDEDQWYMLSDVVNILGVDSVAFPLLDGESSTFDIDHDGEKTFLSSSGLATVVDKAVGTDYDSPRSMWIQGWYEDLEHYVETGEELEDFGQGTGDSILSMIDGTCAMRIEGIRERAREAATELHEVAESLGDAKTFLDGFSSALTVVGMDNVRGTCLYTLGDGLICAINGVASALCTVEGIADGDDDGK